VHVKGAIKFPVPAKNKLAEEFVTNCFYSYFLAQSIHLIAKGEILNSRRSFVQRSLAAALVAVSLASPCARAQAPEVPAITAAPESDPALRLPELKASEWFDGQAGGTFGEKAVNFLPRAKRVAVVGFKVIFVNETFARARVRASYMPGRDTTGASAAMQVNLAGVDAATLQTLTDQAYARFIAQLRAAGREVMTVADAKWDYSEFQSVPAPAEINEGDTKGSAFSPKGMPLWFQIAEFGGPRLEQTNGRAMGTASHKAGAPLMLATTVVVDFAQMASSGNRSGLVARTAEVGATLAMSVRRLDTRLTRAEEVKGGILYKGDDAWLRLTKPLETDLEFAVLKVAEKDHGSGVGGFLSRAFVGNAKTVFRRAETSNGEYSKAATAVLERATGTLAKLFAENAPQ
jgi:hypothetical protein